MPVVWISGSHSNPKFHQLCFFDAFFFGYKVNFLMRRSVICLTMTKDKEFTQFFEDEEGKKQFIKQRRIHILNYCLLN